MKPIKNFNYQKVKSELDEILAWFEGGEVSIDEALIKYEKAEKLLKQLDIYLNNTKNKIEQIIKKSSKS